MKIFLDFEATQPEGEIIQVGAVSEKGQKFNSLVKPMHSTVTQYITQLTGITNMVLDNAPTIPLVFCELYYWCHSQCSDPTKWEFYVYGDQDADFIKYSINDFTTGQEKGLWLACQMIVTLKDFSKETRQFFKGNVSLLRAYNCLMEQESAQKHSAIEDAEMLAALANKMECTAPYTEYPDAARAPSREEDESNYRFPTGRFFVRGQDLVVEKKFNSIQDAIDWVILTNVNPEDAESVHRNRIAVKIMKAIRGRSRYQGYRWRREM